MLPIGDGPLLASPSFVTSWPDNPGILVVAERATALVTAWNVTDGVGPITVVDLSSEAFLPGSNGDQIGVTGVAFHPHFNRNPDRRFVYVRYNAALANSTVQTRVKRWKIPPGTLTVIPSTGVQMYKWDTTSTQHGSGTIHFDTREVADPVLYVPMPDDASPGNCTPAGLVQDTQGPSDLGKLLSVDVNQTLPVVTKLSTGLRNPYGFSVDRGDANTGAGQGDVWLGDVGGPITGSILRWIPTSGFQNYGWPWYEGRAYVGWVIAPAVDETLCGMVENLPGNPGYLPPSSVTDPTAVFSDQVEFGGLRDALIGGYVYRGTAISSLVGQYVFATFGVTEAHVYSLQLQNIGMQTPTDLAAPLGMTAWSTDHLVFSMGQDASGELYLARVDASLPIAVNGEVFKVTP